MGTQSEDSDGEHCLDDLFSGAARCEDEVEQSDDDADWEEVCWTPDAQVPQILIHRRLAQCWSSARMMAEWILSSRGVIVKDAFCLELGASLALPSLAASVAGAARCVATDIYPSSGAEALETTMARNRRVQNRPDLFATVSARRLDWFKVPEDLGDLLGAADVVLCADVIYEQRAAPAIALAADLALRPGGCLVFASRVGRVGLDTFLEAALSGNSREPGAGSGFILEEEQPLQSARMGLGLTEEDEHRLWIMRKRG
mmetsp:Transcript_17395/g.38043  ORF Transcript_17395/g.38043 Transcript_17395/m.38043 type:complete len:258 (-) Transcript_17395:122-895(-)